MERKYIFEAGLNVFTYFKTLIPVEQLSLLEQFDNRKYHLYAILSYPQVYIDNTHTYLDEQGLHISLFTYINDSKEEYTLPILNIPPGLNHNDVDIIIKYPNTFFTFKITNKKYLATHPNVNSEQKYYAHDLFIAYSRLLAPKLEFEVLYIGQSFGNRGERTAITRLSSHSTLQKILTDCQSKYADKHIYLLLMETSTNINMSFDGISNKYTLPEEDSDQHLMDVLTNLPEEQQIVNISEAALIHYFKPEYNRNFIENFPNENHKGYKQYFDLDYNSFIFELDLEFDNTPIVQLYTKTNLINSCYDHIFYKLFNDPNRKSMYDIFDN